MSAIIEKYVKIGITEAEFGELFTKLFMTEIYAGCTIRHNTVPMRFTIKVLNPIEAIGENRYKLRQLQSMIAQRLNLDLTGVEIVFEKIVEKNLEPAYHAEQLRQAFLSNTPYKKVVNNICRAARASGAQGVTVFVSGKLKGQRAKGIRFIDGLLLQSGEGAKDYIKTTQTTALCKQGIIGITVSLMLPYDSEGIKGPNRLPTDHIAVLDVKTFY